MADVVDKFIETPDEKAAFKTVMAKMAQEPGLAQVELNKIGAAHRSIFVAGWRPFIGWVCGISLAIYYLPQFTAASFMWVLMFVNSCSTECVVPAYPIDSIKGLMELILGMLGLAGRVTKPGVKVYKAALKKPAPSEEKRRRRPVAG